MAKAEAEKAEKKIETQDSGHLRRRAKVEREREKEQLMKHGRSGDYENNADSM